MIELLLTTLSADNYYHPCDCKLVKAITGTGIAISTVSRQCNFAAMTMHTPISLQVIVTLLGLKVCETIALPLTQASVADAFYKH